MKKPFLTIAFGIICTLLSVGWNLTSIPPPPLTISLSPSSVTVPCDVIAGTLISTISATGGNGSPVTFSITMATGFNSNDFVVNSSTIVVGSNGIDQSECVGIDGILTVSASQI